MFRQSVTLFPLLVLGLCGCGGHDGSGRSAVNPFQGAYSGTYVATFLGDSGTFDPIVSQTGVVSGSAHSNVQNDTGTLSGNITATGVIHASLAFPSHPTATFTGTLVQDVDGHLHGVLTEAIGGQSGDVDIQADRL